MHVYKLIWCLINKHVVHRPKVKDEPLQALHLPIVKLQLNSAHTLKKIWISGLKHLNQGFWLSHFWNVRSHYYNYPITPSYGFLWSCVTMLIWMQLLKVGSLKCTWAERSEFPLLVHRTIRPPHSRAQSLCKSLYSLSLPHFSQI